ncbi:hypothetical protein NC796_18220 [Aliifodinibius sp. S!AR15-10]|uniref:MauE/DoxX family redox-associated membrane protein n=1 Tax=Aliifodinibius sp. S!AR15-10 TaxID=2950437 RepID=UPI00285E5D54|nr:MauE/DoxX family redox-associated membrane protein [Aliifodinibius sp. S!AR15-10]MDR8393098.1 hypothetical protein [Aliifodinibius sp. S!AR15-10]
MSPKTQKYTLLAIRILLGGVFLLSGIGKLIDSSDAVYLVELMATKFYWLIEYSNIIVISTSVLELLLAGLLFWGRKLTWVLLASFLLILAFTTVLSYFYIQGMSVASCGCFGAFGGGGGITVTLIRNLVLIALILGGYIFNTKS